MPTQNPTLLEADFMDEVYDFLAYVTSVGEGRIFRGNQSREVLPDDDSFIIYTPILRKRIGSNIVNFDAADCDDDTNGAYNDSALIQVDIQVDFYGENAQDLAQGLEVFSHSTLCRSWLVSQGSAIRVLYCSDPIDATYVGETDQYATRWMVTLSICFGSAVTNGQPWYEDVVFKGTHIDPNTGELTPPSQAGLVDVDVYFKP
jgi:hypothetical protein